MANQDEARLHYPLGDQLPAPGTSIEVAPGVKWVRLPLPFALDHINVWLLRDHMEIDGQRREGWTIVDCGVAKPALQEQWQQVFKNELQGLPVLRVLVTHMHPDHIGLADWICQQWTTPEHACRLWISATDFGMASLGTHGGTGFGGDEAAEFFRTHGLVEPEQLGGMHERRDYYSSLVPSVPSSYRRLHDGQSVRIGDHDWECIVGFGHAPEHIALSQPGLGVLISGDMVLPRISTNVSVFNSEPESNPLQLFLDSLERYLPLRADTLVLPSHGKPFGAAPQDPFEHGLHERIRQLKSHHSDRLAEVVEACQAKPCCGMDIVPIMFKRPLNLHQISFALGEAIAHLHALWYAGVLHRTRDAQGIWRFHADAISDSV